MACYNACKFDAITIVENGLAVKVPSVNTERCRNCGLCEKSCPVINAPVFNAPQHAYAANSKEEPDRSTCASGGAATVFSRAVLNRGGIVYGATAYGGYPKYIRITDSDDLKLLKGSKYVYCDPGKIYCQVQGDLKEGKECLFIGLPCSVAGLLQYLGKPYDKLHTIDLVCHGTPPFEYLNQHLSRKRIEAQTIGNITFRGEIDYQTVVYDHKDKIVYKRNHKEDEYLVAFLKGVMHRPVCYSCRFAKRERVADITIGDFWGIPKGALNSYEGKISLILANTDKGNSLFQASSDDFVWEERSVEEAVAGNARLNRPSVWTKEAETFHAVYTGTKSVAEAFRMTRINRIARKNRLRRHVLYIPKLIRDNFGRLFKSVCR